MKNIDVTQIVDPSIQQPFTGPSLKFLQDASLETFKAVGRNLVTSRGLSYASGTPYLIDSIHAYEAMIFYNGEFFLTSSSPITGYAHLDTTPDAYADPLLFTDGVSRNVHNDRYLYFDANATGALFNASAIVDITTSPANTAFTLLNSWTVYSSLTASYQTVGNRVFMNGALYKTPDNSGIIAVLPAPSLARHGVCMALDGANYTANLWTVTTAGNLTITNPSVSGTGYILFLDGINYQL